MTQDLNTSRRSFLKGGAVIAAPLAVAMPSAVLARDTREQDLAALEDERTIAGLRDTWLRHVNNGAFVEARAMMPSTAACRLDDGICSISADQSAAPGALTIAEDRQTAAQQIHCQVAMETALEKDCTLALMAHAQGTGVVRRQEKQSLQLSFARGEAGWAISEASLAPA